MNSSNRTKIAKAIVTLINTNFTGINYSTRANNRATNKLAFWDEINNYPYIGVIAGQEYREYLPANFKWGFLTITFRIYVNDPKPQEELESIMQDIEDLLDANNDLIYDTGKTTEDIRILSITTDEGVLSPIGVGEIIAQVRYDL